MIKRHLYPWMAILILLMLLPIGAFAANSGETGYVFYTDASGQNPSESASGKALKWTVTAASPNGTVDVAAADKTIAGNAAIPASVSDAGGHTYSVTGVANNGFMSCKSLTAVTLPDSIVKIGSTAFAYCTAMTEASLPDSVTSLGAGAFFGCSKLKNVTIPSAVSVLEKSVFADCVSLEGIVIPSSVKSVEGNPFTGCTNLCVAVPITLEKIDMPFFTDTPSERYMLYSDQGSTDSAAFDDLAILLGIPVGERSSVLKFSYAVRQNANGTLKARIVLENSKPKCVLTASPAKGFQLKSVQYSIGNGEPDELDAPYEMLLNGSLPIIFSAEFDQAQSSILPPKTGDAAIPALWLAVGLMCLCAAVHIRRKEAE